MCLVLISKWLVAGLHSYNPPMSLLYCDPSKPHHVLLRCGDAVLDLAKPHAAELLRAMTTLMEQATAESHESVEGIVVVNQAESFTLIRVIATIANALAYSKGLKLYALASSEAALGEPVPVIVPQYSAAPNITPAKVKTI